MNKVIYETNIKMFEKSFPGIGKLIDKSRNKMDGGLEVYLEQAADGNNIIKVKKEDRELYFNGKREPADKVRIELEKWGKIDKHAVIFVTGLGDITFLKKLLSVVETSTQIVIYEPSINIFYKVFDNIDLSFLFADRIPALIVDGLNEDEKSGVIGNLVTLSNIEFIKHYENRNYVELFSSQILKYWIREFPM